MKARSDLDKIIATLDTLGVPHTIFTKKGFIMDEALELGAISTVSVRDEVDFAFDKNGEFVGSFTSAANSFIARKK